MGMYSRRELAQVSTDPTVRAHMARRARDSVANSRDRAGALPGGARGPSGLPVLAARRGRGRLLPRGDDGLFGAQAVMSAAGSRRVVVVMGTDGDEPPPGIERIEDLVDIRYAPDGKALAIEMHE